MDTKQPKGCSKTHQELEHYSFQKTAGWDITPEINPTASSHSMWNLSLDFKDCAFALQGHEDTQTQGKVMYRMMK